MKILALMKIKLKKDKNLDDILIYKKEIEKNIQVNKINLKIGY